MTASLPDILKLPCGNSKVIPKLGSSMDVLSFSVIAAALGRNPNFPSHNCFARI